MSVRELCGRFKGLRVQRTINKKAYLKHFSYRIPVDKGDTTTWRDASILEKMVLKKKAQLYDKQLFNKQKKETEKRKFNPIIGCNTNTGVKGIAYRISKDGQGYDVEAFWLNVSDQGKQHSSNIRLNSRSWSEAWKLVVAKLVEVKNLDNAMHKKLLAKMPKEITLRTKS